MPRQGRRAWTDPHPEAAVAVIHRRDIDGLRALAVLPVVLFHFGLEDLSGGFVGVDVFFVISGYLIAASVEADLKAGRFSIKGFYARRLRRIMPALLATLLVTTIGAVWIMSPAQLADYARSLIAAGGFVANLHFWLTSNYFAPAGTAMPLLHTWSLGVEEQYYLIAPLAMMLVVRHGRLRWWTVLVPLMVSSFALSTYGVLHGPTFTFYMLPTRAWELMAGALIWLSPPPPFRSRMVAEAAGVAGLALYLAACLWIDEAMPFPGPLAAIPVLGAVLMILAGRPAAYPAPWVTRLLSLPPLVWIGLISYSLYLVHWPLAAFFTLARLQPPEDPWSLTVIAIAIASLSLLLVERPFRRDPRLTRTAVIFGGTAAGVGLAAVTAGVILRTEGLPGRFPDYTRVATESAPWRNGLCFLEPGDDPAAWTPRDCIRDLGFADTRIMLWGDSFAAQYVSGLAAVAPALGSNVLQITTAGCPPILDYRPARTPGCSRMNQRAFAALDDPTIGTVILAARWSLHRPDVLSGLRETVLALEARRLTVVVIGPSPEFVGDVQWTAYRRGKRGEDPMRQPFAKTEGAAAAVRAALAGTGATYIAPMELLCDSAFCPVGVPGKFDYFDFGHMTTSGATRALSAYVEYLGIDNARFRISLSEK